MVNCPTTFISWYQAVNNKQCSAGTDYHCTKNDIGVFMEYCSRKTWIQTGHCPEYNRKANTIDAVLCSDRFGKCPTETYWSNAVYKFPGCFSVASTTKTATTNYTTAATTTTTTTGIPNTDENGKLLGIAIGIPVIVFILIGLLVCVVCYRRRKIKRSKDDHVLFAGDHIEFQGFCSTSAHLLGKRKLRNRDFLVYIGTSGSGKTFTSLQILDDLSINDDTGLDVIVNSLHSWDYKLSKYRHVCLLIDDCFGKWHIDPDELKRRLRKLEDIYSDLQSKHETVKLIVTIPYSVWKRNKFVFIDSKICRSEGEIYLQRFTMDEKRQMLSDNMENNNMKMCENLRDENCGDVNIINKHKEVKLSKGSIERILTMNAPSSDSIPFPTACYLFCKERGLTLKGVSFFENPRISIESFLKENFAHTETRLKFCALVYCLYAGGEFDTVHVNHNLLKTMGDVLNLSNLNERRLWASVTQLQNVYLNTEAIEEKRKKDYKISVKHSCILECVYKSLTEEQRVALSKTSITPELVWELDNYSEQGPTDGAAYVS